MAAAIGPHGQSACEVGRVGVASLQVSAVAAVKITAACRQEVRLLLSSKRGITPLAGPPLTIAKR
jgi:hypothetical protein